MFFVVSTVYLGFVFCLEKCEGGKTSPSSLCSCDASSVAKGPVDVCL
jgi:hypothetical protein